MLLAVVACLWTVAPMAYGETVQQDTTKVVATDTLQADTLAVDSAMALVDADLGGADEEALEIVYLTLSEVNTKKLLAEVDRRLEKDDVEGAKDLCRNTRGPVASICYQALLHIREKVDDIDRQLTNYGTVQISNMEKGCSWIRLFIAIAPSLGFLGTVIGMVMAFDNIEVAGNISPTIVAKGMKVALITTIFGIIVAIVLQFFYSYILSKIDRLTTQMEEGAITLMDAVVKYKARNNG